VEPPRDTLLALAKAAEVTVGWLAAGEQAAAAPVGMSLPDEVLTQLRAKLTVFSGSPPLWAALMKDTGLSEVALREIMGKRIPSVGELWALIGILLGSRLGPSDPVAKELRAIPDVGAKLEAAGSASVPLAIPGEGVFHTVTTEASLSLNGLIAALSKTLGSKGVRWFKIPNDTMEPNMHAGDMVIIRETAMLVHPGLYLFRGPKGEFLSRAVVLPEGTIQLYYDNPVYKEQSKIAYVPERYHCVGPVVAHLQVIQRDPVATGGTM
jgi:hypothetical protein